MGRKGAKAHRQREVDGLRPGNSTRQPRKGSTSGKATEAYEGVHTDVWGPIKSHRGNRYLLTITDDYTHTVKVYCMKLKSEARECFINFEKEVKLRHGKDIKSFINHYGSPRCKKGP